MAKGSAKKRLGVSSGILQSNAYCLNFSDIIKHFNERIQVTKKMFKILGGFEVRQKLRTVHFFENMCQSR